MFDAYSMIILLTAAANYIYVIYIMLFMLYTVYVNYKLKYH